MRKVSKVLAFLVVPAIIAAVRLWQGDQDAPPPPAHTAAIRARDLPGTSTAARAEAAPPPAKVVVSDQMRRQFETTQNYAAFIQDAMQRPAEGGRFYAAIANARCMAITPLRLDTSAVLKGDVAERARRYVEDLHRRCNGVQVDQNSQVTFLRTLSYSNSKAPDALMLGKSDLREAVDAEEIKAQLIHARQSGDPYLMGLRLDQYAESFAPTIDPAYAGQSAPPEVLRAATLAAMCELIGDCVDNLQLYQQCYLDGVCQFPDLRDYLRSQIPAPSWPLFDKTVKALLKIGGKA